MVYYYVRRNNQLPEKNAANLPLEEPMAITHNGKPINATTQATILHTE